MSVERGGSLHGDGDHCMKPYGIEERALYGALTVLGMGSL